MRTLKDLNLNSKLKINVTNKESRIFFFNAVQMKLKDCSERVQLGNSICEVVKLSSKEHGLRVYVQNFGNGRLMVNPFSWQFRLIPNPPYTVPIHGRTKYTVEFDNGVIKDFKNLENVVPIEEENPSSIFTFKIRDLFDYLVEECLNYEDDDKEIQKKFRTTFCKLVSGDVTFQRGIAHSLLIPDQLKNVLIQFINEGKLKVVSYFGIPI